MKLLASIFTIILTIVLIYYTTIDNRIYVLNLGQDQIYDYKTYNHYVTEYLEAEDIHENTVTIQESLNKIVNNIIFNKKIENRTLKNHLIKTDLIVITSMNETYEELDYLLKTIREYCKEKVILVTKNNKKNDELVAKYNIKIIDIYTPLETNIMKNMAISNQIIEYINKNILNTTWNNKN